jgi:hypothetical protein
MLRRFWFILPQNEISFCGDLNFWIFGIHQIFHGELNVKKFPVNRVLPVSRAR